MLLQRLFNAISYKLYQKEVRIIRKVKFLKDFYTFDKDLFRVILAEDNEYYYIQENLHTLDKFRLPKRDTGDIYQIVERSQEMLLTKIELNMINTYLTYLALGIEDNGLSKEENKQIEHLSNRCSDVVDEIDFDEYVENQKK